MNQVERKGCWGKNAKMGDFLSRLAKCIIGVFTCAFGNVLMIHASLGLNPWGILHQGIALNTTLTFGEASQVLGLVIVVVCCAFRFFPGLSTMLYIFFFGYFVDLLQATGWFFTPRPAVLQWALLLTGNATLAFGCWLYLNQRLGAGPKDELMLLITQKSKADVAVVRVAMELTATLAGYLMRGPFGLGTIVCALTFGPILRTIFRLNGYDAKTVRHENILETLRQFQS